MEIKDIKIVDFTKGQKETVKTFPKCKIYKGSLIQQVRQYIKDLDNGIYNRSN